jgi:ABC-2 type transport system permease protein
MNKNLFFKEIRFSALSFLLWMVVIIVLISVTMSVYPTFSENQSKVFGMLNLIPKGALQFKGISNLEDLLSVLGFYAVNNVIYMMVLGSIFSIVLSSNILLKEEYNKTAEYLMTRPLARGDIFLSKLAALHLNILCLNLVSALTGFICLELVKEDPFSIRAFLILTLYTYLLNFLFGAIGLFISTLVKRPKPITTFAIGLVLFFYFLYTLSKITESVSNIGYLSPFKYVALDVAHPEYRLDPFSLVYFIGISFLLTGISYRIYCRKDIYL